MPFYQSPSSAQEMRLCQLQCTRTHDTLPEIQERIIVIPPSVCRRVKIYLAYYLLAFLHRAYTPPARALDSRTSYLHSLATEPTHLLQLLPNFFPSALSILFIAPYTLPLTTSPLLKKIPQSLDRYPFHPAKSLTKKSVAHVPFPSA